jgi:hypothetical protein
MVRRQLFAFALLELDPELLSVGGFWAGWRSACAANMMSLCQLASLRFETSIAVAISVLLRLKLSSP